MAALMTRCIRFVGLAVALALASIAIGCGGGDRSSSSESSSGATVTADSNLTKAEFIKQADAICEKTDKAQEAALKVYLQKHPKATSSEDGEGRMVLVAGLPPIQVEIEELAALGAPSGEEDKVQAIVEGIEEAAQKGKENPNSLVTGTKNPFAAVDKLAGEYGFKACNNAL